MIKKLTQTKIWDRIGICSSTICLIHCLLVPVVVLAFPGMHILAHNHEFHLIMAVLVTISMGMAILPHCNKHGHKDIIALAVTGSLLIIGALVLEHDIGETIAHVMTMLGSVMLIWGHLKNMKVRHGKCDSDCA